jgi:NAD(P)-dependent dehydrogenase (short-subunit alcohol dehydrogenase family)
METVLITGSNRGLGFEWAKQYAEAGYRVVATCRHPSEASDLRALAETYPRVSLHRLDVTNIDEINALAVELLNEPIDILINNAGIYLEKYWDVGLHRLNYQDWEHTFRVNTLGPVRVTEALIDSVSRSSRRQVVITSTHMASITDITAPGGYYYRSTKAALNAVMEGLAHELTTRGVGLLILHPGHVRTRMGGGGTSLEAPESVRGMRSLVDRFTMEDSGRFIRYDGVPMPW